MAIYQELTTQQQEKAREFALSRLLQVIIEGGIRFNDDLNNDTLQARIDGAVNKAEEMQTPWFAGEYILDVAHDELEGMAQCDAEDAYYPVRGQQCIAGVA